MEIERILPGRESNGSCRDTGSSTSKINNIRSIYKTLSKTYNENCDTRKDNNNSTPEIKDKMEIVWLNVFIMIYLHVGGIIGGYFMFGMHCHWQTVILGFFFGYFGAFGITVGAHRLWAHKSFKAKLPLRILLAFMQTVACQNSIHEWCRDHRVHHKFTETNADPHNAKRGFFFAHVGWLLCKKHEDVKFKGKVVDMSDLEEDLVVMFQKKYFIPLTILASFVIPTLIPYYLWNEDGFKAWSITLLRYVLTLNATWLVNSAAHLFGHKPYDKNINPSENKLVSILTNGEGWHNYHHVFPWDYKAAELGLYKHNISTGLIDFFAWMGLAHDLKSVPERIVYQRVLRTGDGSYCKEEDKEMESSKRKERKSSKEELNHPGGCLLELDGNRNYISTEEPPQGHSWGWDDKDTPNEDKEITIIRYHND